MECGCANIGVKYGGFLPVLLGCEMSWLETQFVTRGTKPPRIPDTQIVSILSGLMCHCGLNWSDVALPWDHICDI